MQIEQELGNFTGTENWYRHWSKSLLWTDGIMFLADKAKAHWLIEVVASYQLDYRNKLFQVWTLRVNKDNAATITMKEDTNEPIIVEQKIHYTDFPLKEFEFYVVNGVMMLKSEY